MSNLSLSKAVRSNLLSLQSTASMMAKTQSRLATGLKVNTALDNPTNFFTASALNGRAGDLSNLLDGLSSGIKTIEAADNGLKSITKTVESMQSTLRQARQDKSFKSQSFSIDAARTGLLEFSGGAVGSATVGVSLGSASPVQSTFTTTGDFDVPSSPYGGQYFTFSADGQSFAGGSSDFDIIVDGSIPFSFSLDNPAVTSVGNNNSVIDNIDEYTDAINAALAADAPSAPVSVTNDGTRVYMLSDTAGPSSDFIVQQINGSGVFGDYGLTTSSFIKSPGSPSKTIEISDGSTTATINLDEANAGTISAARLFIQSELDALNMDITVGGSGSRIDLAGAADGSNTVSVGGADAETVFGSAGTQLAGAIGGTYSVDHLVQSINSMSGLEGKTRASNDGGRLRIENLSSEAMTVHGIGTDGEIDGTLGTASIGGNDVRANLIEQFNGLRDQLDRFADDASFNGINLLRGDKLKLTFNEIGTSTIEIQVEDTAGQARSISSLALGLDEELNADFDSDATLDALLDTMKSALDTLRSQSSAFGSKLSVVENRNEFTKSMINTLETGAANLTLADTNQEAANLLALQTRQQLSSTALSMASQADQAVLPLF